MEVEQRVTPNTVKVGPFVLFGYSFFVVEVFGWNGLVGEAAEGGLEECVGVCSYRERRLRELHILVQVSTEVGIDAIVANYDGICDLIKRMAKDGSPSSDDSIEIVSFGGKRVAPADEPNHALKRARLVDGAEPIKVLKLDLELDLALVPPAQEPELQGEIDAAAKKLNTLLAKHPQLHHPHVLTPIQFVQKKGLRGQPPHELSVCTPEAREAHSLTPLLHLDPYDPTNSLAKSWAVKPISPNSRYLKIVPGFGEGGLVDAVVFLATQKLLQLESSLSVSPPRGIGKGAPIFHLHLEVALLPLFYKSYYSGPKRLLLHHLFPPEAPPPDYKGETDVDFFFSCLGRAPRTVGGLAVGTRRMRPGMAKALETEEEKEAKERRKQKGKGKARNQDGDGDEEMEEEEEEEVEKDDGVEDALLYPPGLKATLMPFQSRSVRWLLAREGKMAAKPADDDEEMADEPPLEDEDELERAVVAEKHAPSKLEDLPEELHREILRGPLWEKATIALPTEDGERPRSQEFWLNRVASQLTLNDPAILTLDDDDDEPQDEAQDVDELDEDVVVEAKPALALGSGQGLLSEEMGLGKTVEVLSLILLHRQPERNLLPAYYSPLVDSEVQPAGLTLIIAPSAIVEQWATEIKKHAPGLRVLRYEAIKNIKEAWKPNFIAKQYDIILTTFDVLRREVVLARKPHQRALRSGPEGRHRYRRSLLVQFEFLRVIMDEAQMVGDTVSATSETASLIPRKYSFAVTGTPLKANINDLQGLLRFLKVEPVGSYKASLQRLLEEVPTFVRVCEQLAARTVKSQVQHELVIPNQHRYIVPVEFGPVESYWYEQRYLEALNALGLESDGTPKNPPHDRDGSLIFEMDKAELNRWLVVLRQACVHTQVGQQNKRVLGNVLKSVEDVLTSMTENAISSIHSETRQLWADRVKRSQLLMFDREECERFEKALGTFKLAHKEIEPIVQEIAQSIRETYAQRKIESARRGRSKSASVEIEGDDIGNTLALGFDDDEKNDRDDIPLSEKERSLASRLGALRNRLRETLLVQHASLFFTGSAYFNMGKFADEENEAYKKAETLRQSMLRPYERNVERGAVKLREQLDARERAEKFNIKQMEFAFSRGKVHGLLGQALFEDIEITSDSLNGIAELIFQWRDLIHQMIFKTVTISGDDATGEEYEERAELQQKLDVYIESYNALVGDWRYLLTGEQSALADALNAEALGPQKSQWAAAEGARRKREKKNKKRKRIDLDKIVVPTLERGDLPADILRYELLVERAGVQGERNIPQKPKPGPAEGEKKKRKKKDDEDSDEDDGVEEEDPNALPIRTIISKLKTLIDDADPMVVRDEELALLKNEMSRLRAQLAPKEKIIDRLRAEHADVSKAFNDRVQYFIQLQIISDDVGDPDFESRKWKGLAAEMDALRDEEDTLALSIIKKKSERRYLESLNGEEAEEDAQCLICGDEYTHGVLTACAHMFCKTCFVAWHQRGRNCPVCKRELRSGDWHDVRYRAKGIANGDVPAVNSGVKIEEEENLPMVDIEAPVKLNNIDADELAAIREIPTAQPLSAKSDLIAKHIKYLRRDDPTSKIVLFSAFTDALAILQQAFARNSIEYVRLEGTGKKEHVVTRFATDPNVAVFLLHTRSQSAGLNLTCARYVFLVEPLLHSSLELQAVGRIHRIGQAKETAVFQYSVLDTVDARVAELRGRQRSSLFTGDGSVNMAKESKLLVDDATKNSNSKNSDETIDSEDDLAQCLLSKQHYLNLQGALLPPHLQGKMKEKAQTNLTPSQVAGLAAYNRLAGVGGSGSA
ncbi:SNF4 family helicase/atpase [Pseudohyphozyma bogoriensis]|nr:SNF4 family helicase/atpase [Pseudohyphozyma bogoriensis]